MATETAQAVSFTVNGAAEVVEAPPLQPLSDVLREELGLTGTKLGCRAGDCGSCTVLVDGVARTSCLIPIAQIEGHEVVTIEGLAEGATLHPVQQAFRDHNASQCGYCIPGIVVTAAAMQASGTVATREDIVTELSGNLCRCTGYTAVVDAIAAACGLRDVPAGTEDEAER